MATKTTKSKKKSINLNKKFAKLTTSQKLLSAALIIAAAIVIGFTTKQLFAATYSIVPIRATGGTVVTTPKPLTDIAFTPIKATFVRSGLAADGKVKCGYNFETTATNHGQGGVALSWKMLKIAPGPSVIIPANPEYYTFNKEMSSLVVKNSQRTAAYPVLLDLNMAYVLQAFAKSGTSTWKSQQYYLRVPNTAQQCK